MDVTFILVFLSTFLVCAYIANRFGFLSNKTLPPGPWGVPIVGHLLLFGQYPPATFEKWRQKYGNVFRIQLGSWNCVVINGYDAIKEAADYPQDTFSHRPPLMTQTLLREVNGTHSFAFGPFDDDYLYCRKVISSKLRTITDQSNSFGFQHLIVDEAESMVKALLKRAEEKKPLSIVSDLQLAVGSSVYQMLYGKGQSIREDDRLIKMIENNNEFVKFSKNGNPFDVMPWLAHILPKQINTLREFNKTLNDLRVTNIKEHERRFNIEHLQDMTDMLLAMIPPGTSVSDEQEKTRARLLSTLTDLGAAAVETTVTSMKWLILYMIAYPDTQRQIQQEICDVIGSERPVDIADRKNLPYTDAVIHEVLRITCVLPFSLPHSSGEDASVNGFDIPKGTLVLFNLYSVAHEKNFWGDPVYFRPERFLDGNKLDVHRTSRVMPFGLGRRRCIGDFVAKMELFLLFVTLMQKCTFMKPEGAILDLDAVPGLVYGPKPYEVMVEERL